MSMIIFRNGYFVSGKGCGIFDKAEYEDSGSHCMGKKMDSECIILNQNVLGSWFHLYNHRDFDEMIIPERGDTDHPNHATFWWSTLTIVFDNLQELTNFLQIIQDDVDWDLACFSEQDMMRFWMEIEQMADREEFFKHHRIVGNRIYLIDAEGNVQAGIEITNDDGSEVSREQMEKKVLDVYYEYYMGKSA